MKTQIQTNLLHKVDQSSTETLPIFEINKKTKDIFHITFNDEDLRNEENVGRVGNQLVTYLLTLPEKLHGSSQIFTISDEDSDDDIRASELKIGEVFSLTNLPEDLPSLEIDNLNDLL